MHYFAVFIDVALVAVRAFDCLLSSSTSLCPEWTQKTFATGNTKEPVSILAQAHTRVFEIKRSTSTYVALHLTSRMRTRMAQSRTRTSTCTVMAKSRVQTRMAQSRVRTCVVQSHARPRVAESQARTRVAQSRAQILLAVTRMRTRVSQSRARVCVSVTTRKQGDKLWSALVVFFITPF